MVSRRSGSATAQHTRLRDPGGSWGRSGPRTPPSQSSWASFLGDFSGAPEKSSAIGQVGAGCWFREEEGGRSLEEPGGREEGGGRRVPRRIWQMASLLPSPKCRAGARGGARQLLCHQTPGAPRCSDPSLP